MDKYVVDFYNGNYVNKCISCGNQFYGHKRRKVCTPCGIKSLKAHHEAMMPKENVTNDE